MKRKVEKKKVMASAVLKGRSVSFVIDCPDDVTAGKWLAIFEAWIDDLAAKQQARVIYPPKENGND